MGVILHGTRYLRPGAEELFQTVNDELHYLDYDSALKFYRYFVRWTDHPADYAFLAANDRYFLLTYLLARRDALHPWLYDRCREVEADPDNYLDLWGREHYKSTIITFAGTIQEIIRNPEITVGIFSHTKGTARKFLSQIKSELESNQALKNACPDVFWLKPENQAPKWSLGEGLICIRKGNPKEATIEANGLVDGMPVGAHYRLRIYDDLIEEKYVTNADMIEKATRAWENSSNLGTVDGRKWHVGTRWDLADPYQEMLDKKLLRARVYPSTHNGKLDGSPVFLPLKRWNEIKREQSRVVAAQHLQNPAMGSQSSFDMAWFKLYEVRPTLLNVYILVDPSGGKGKTSDRTAMAVIGVDINKNKYLLDGFRHRMNLGERWEKLLYLHRRWANMQGVQEVYVGYERYSMQADIEHYQQRMTDENYEFIIEELNWTGPENRSKTDRVNRLQPDIEGTDYKFYFPREVWYPGLGICKWAYSEETQTIEYTPIECDLHSRDPTTGKLTRYRTGEWELTKGQLRADHDDRPWAKSRPIKQLDENGDIYDLTRAAFEELRFFPRKKGHDDLVDAMSRLYDEKMAYAPPTLFENAKNEQQVFRDT